MAKQIHNRVSLASFEIKAQEIISLTFDLCEQALRELRPQQGQAPDSRRKALQFAALSVLNSIKSFQAIVKIKPE